MELSPDEVFNQQQVLADLGRSNAHAHLNRNNQPPEEMVQPLRSSHPPDRHRYNQHRSRNDTRVRGGRHGQIFLRACTVYISDSEPDKMGSLPESSRTNPTPDNFVFHTVVNDKKSVLGILQIYGNFRKRTPDEFYHLKQTPG